MPLIIITLNQLYLQKYKILKDLIILILLYFLLFQIKIVKIYNFKFMFI